MIDYGRFAERLAAHRANQDPARRWDLYKELHAEWGYVPRERKPFSAEVQAAIGRAPSDGHDGLPGIPVALAEWMALPENSTADGNAGGLECVWPPEWGEPGPDGLRMVRFVADDLDMCQMAYRSADGSLTDSVVLFCADGGRWVVVAPSISEFALRQAAAWLPIYLGWHATPPDDFEDKVIERVRATWPEMGFPVGREPIGDFMLHGGPDAIAMVADPDGNWWDYMFLLNGRTKEAVEAAAAGISGDDCPLDQWYVWEGEL